MSGRLAMREAIQAFLEGLGLENVGTVYAARPEILPEQAYEANRMGEAVESAAGSSAVLVVNLPEDTRRRRADTGRGAVNDSRLYKAAVEVWFASTGGEAVQAQKDYDGIIDGIVDGIRSDATLGNPDVVWSAGEYDDGVEHVQGQPYTDADGLTVFIAGVVRFEAWSWLAGNV